MRRDATSVIYIVVCLLIVTLSGVAAQAAALQRPADGRSTQPSSCKDNLDQARRLATSGDRAGAERMLLAVTRQCAKDATAWRELAALRFADSRWHDAEGYSLHAVHLAPEDEEGWRLLATSRYMRGDYRGALSAWNHVDQPRLTGIDVRGARRTRASVIDDLIDLEPGTLLTPGAYLRARHRVEMLPVSFDTRLSYEPQDAGGARLKVLLDERDVVPTGLIPIGMVGIGALILDELKLEVAGPTGSGEDIVGSWRWSEPWQRMTLGIAMPAPGALPGLLWFDGLFERQTYALGASFRAIETRRRAALGLSDWLTSWLRWEGGAAADQFDDRGYASVNGTIEARLAKDHLSLSLDGGGWTPVSGGDRFGSAGFQIATRSTTVPERPALFFRAGASGVTDAAPLGIWPAAGSSLSRAGSLRAHRLRQHDGTLVGEAFGRQLTFGSIEYEQPLWRSPAGPLAGAIFADTARAWRRAGDLAPTPWHVDVGVGIRVHAPSVPGVFRLDIATGLVDGRIKASLGFMPQWPKR